MFLHLGSSACEIKGAQYELKKNTRLIVIETDLNKVAQFTVS